MGEALASQSMLEPHLRLVTENSEIEPGQDVLVNLEPLSFDNFFFAVVDKHINQLPSWPTYQSIELSQQNVVGSDVVPATPLTRLRSVILTSERLAPDSVMRPAEEQVLDSLKTTIKFLQGEKTINGVRYPRQNLLEITTVLAALELGLGQHNDPLLQVLDSVSERFGHVIGDETVAKLRFDALLCGRQRLIVQIYNDFIAGLRRLANQSQPAQLASSDHIADT